MTHSSPPAETHTKQIPTGKAKRINVTLPEYVLNTVDHWAKVHGESRSGLLAEASMDYIARRR